MYRGLFLTLLLVTAVYPKYLPISDGREGTLKHELLHKYANAVVPRQLEVYEDLLDDYSDILTSANWRNDKTENIWIHGNLSDQTSSVRPPGNKGFIEINYPSGSASYAHYHSIGFLTFPEGGSLQLDYWLVAKSKVDVELLVQMMQTSSHYPIPLADLTSTYTDPTGSWWKSVEVAIPASNEQVQLCIQGYRKMHTNSGLAIARIYVHNNSNTVITSTEFAATTINPVYTTIEELTTEEVTTEVIPDTTTENTPIDLLDDYSEIVTSTNWQNNKEDNIWVHSSVSEESDAILRPPEGQGFIEINYPSGNNSYAHYHTIDHFTFPRGGLLELDYWLKADALSDSQLRIFTLLAKSHDITLANISYENNNPDSEWQKIKIEIPILEYPVQICIQGHRRRIDSSGLAITRIYFRKN